MALGQNIKALRIKKNLSQEALSALTGGKVSQGAISTLEKRDSTSSRYVVALAKALNVSATELLTGGESESNVHRMVSEPLPVYSVVVRDINNLLDDMNENGKYVLLGMAKVVAVQYPVKKNHAS